MDRKIIRAQRVRELLGGISAATLLRLRKQDGFPQAVAMPGKPRFFEDEIIHWINARDRGDISIGALLANHPELQKLSPTKAHAELLKITEESEQCARSRGSLKTASAFALIRRWIAAAGPHAIDSAKEFMREAQPQ